MPWPFGGGRWFPGTNLQDLNLDWIIRRVRDLSKGIIAPWINSENFHWMVYDVEQEEFVDSGVSAAGEGVGPPGPQGPAGPQGPVGPQGEKGDTGEGVPAGGTDGDVLVKSGNSNYVATWKKTPPQMGSLAYIEQTSTVSNPNGYQPGDYLVYNGTLYKVVGNEAIGSGNTLQPGVNIVEDRVMDVVMHNLKYGVVTAALSNSISAPQGSAVSFKFNPASIPDASKIRAIIAMAGSVFTNAAGIVITGLYYSPTVLDVYAYMAATSETVSQGSNIILYYIYE